MCVERAGATPTGAANFLCDFKLCVASPFPRSLAAELLYFFVLFVCSVFLSFVPLNVESGFCVSFLSPCLDFCPTLVPRFPVIYILSGNQARERKQS
jgi:hypothetical protein